VTCRSAASIDRDQRRQRARRSHRPDTISRDATRRNRLYQELTALDNLSNTGVVDRDGGRIYVTEAGRPLVRLVAAAFDAYLPKDQKRHSVAV